jgi:hypothetical protein
VNRVLIVIGGGYGLSEFGGWVDGWVVDGVCGRV